MTCLAASMNVFRTGSCCAIGTCIASGSMEHVNPGKDLTFTPKNRARGQAEEMRTESSSLS